MNPEENNPLTNSGAPNFGIPSNPMSFSGNDQSTVDNLSMAGDSLTAAGMAAGPAMPSPVSFDQIDSPSSTGVANLIPNEEPLVPAAPVPGSIGSVTSVPAEPLANPFAPMDATTPSGAMPAPEIQPQTPPYNPFAQATDPVTPVTATPSADPKTTKPMMTPAKNTINPNFQPAPTATKTKNMRSMSPLTAILAIACALLLIATIVFASLFINAKNNPKIVYVPAVSDGESNSQIKFLVCSRNEELNWLINDAYVVPAVRTFSLNYSDDKLSALTDEYQITFANDIDAAAGRDIFNTTSAASLPILSNVEYVINNNILEVTITPTENPLTDAAASTYLYGGTEGVPTTALGDAQGFLESNGFTCSVE